MKNHNQESKEIGWLFYVNDFQNWFCFIHVEWQNNEKDRCKHSTEFRSGFDCFWLPCDVAVFFYRLNMIDCTINTR